MPKPSRIVAAVAFLLPVLATAPAPGAAAAAPGVRNTAASSSNPVYGMDLGLHTTTNDNGSGAVSDAQITQLLTALQGKTQWVRTYDVFSDVSKLAHQMGFNVAATAILGPDNNSSDNSYNESVITQLESLVKSGYAQLAVVGSEQIHVNLETTSQMVGYITQVKNDLAAYHVPVTTVEPDRELIANQALMNAEDVVMANIPPVSYDSNLEHAMTYVKSEYALLGSISHKQVIIGETEWPSDGAGWFFANPIWASLYFNDINRWARVNNVPVFYFEAFDEPYLGNYNTLGAHWGVLTDDGALKPGMSAALQPFPHGHGYWLTARDGGIFPFGSATGYGSTGGMHLNQPIVSMVPTPDGGGYWLVASDGGIFPFGDAGGFGSTGGMHLNQPIVGMAATPDGGGYWLVARDGGIFPFGDAAGYGSTGGMHLNQPIVAMAASVDGRGYFLVAADGGIFTFGSALGYGSTGGMHLNQPIVGMSVADGNGYWLVARDGGIFPFGDAAGYGSTGGTHLNQPIVGMAPAPDGSGYWLVAADGGLFPFGSAAGFGSTGGIHLNQPIVGMAIS